tara:strand:+ start:528 stop:1319 length:792 start_codon:yes stop_codon:yes gene_type:complete
MAQENVKIEKKVYGAKSASDVIDRSFSELLKSKEPINVDKLFRLYNELFYDIPKEGEKSHTTLIVQSTDFVRNFIDPKDAEIDALLERIIDLEEELVSVNDVKEHPFFRNGTFLRISNGTIYFMQEGKARPLSGGTELFNSMARAQGLDPEAIPPPYIEVDASTPREIGYGRTIRSLSDLSDFEEIVPVNVTNFIEARTSLQNVRVNAGQLAELKAIIEDKEVARNIGQINLASAEGQDLIRNAPVNTSNIQQASPSQNSSIR